MIDPVNVRPISIDAPQPATESRPGASGFGDALVNALTEAGNAERAADEAAVKFAAGDPSVGIHEVMIAASEAEIHVRFAVTATSRAIEAYRELLNTPL